MMKRVIISLGVLISYAGIYGYDEEAVVETPGGDCGCSSGTNRGSLQGGSSTSSTITTSGSNTQRYLLDSVEGVTISADGSTSTSPASIVLEEDMVLVPGGAFLMGTDKPQIQYDYEGPARDVTIAPFYMDRYEVSNAAFKRFVDATGYKTESETFGWSFVMDSVAIPASVRASIEQAVLGSEWWLPVPHAYWYQPEGEGTHVFTDTGLPGWVERSNYPVSQVSWNDAVAFCKWRNNSRLPTEAEWERAARGGKEGLVFPWGNTVVSYRDANFEVNGSAAAPPADSASSTDSPAPPARKKEKIYHANIFHGKFPTSNTADDGYEFAAPVDAYGPQNDYGLYNMIGNVWEWVADYWEEPGAALSAEEAEAIPNIDTIKYNKRPRSTERVRRGGSFLCHKSYCYRYRNAARTKNTPDSAAFNQGFRCAKDATESNS